MSFLIETPRLLIRNMELQDIDEIYRLHTDKEVQKYTGDVIPASKEACLQSIKERTFKDYEVYGYSRWTVLEKETRKYIGWNGLKYLPEFDETDLGYRFHQEFWGKGYGTESSLAVMQYAFSELPLKRVIGIAMKENTASSRILEKVGMTFWKEAPYEEGSPDVLWYEIEKNT